MKLFWGMVVLFVTACGAAGPQAAADTCADGGPESMCAAQQTAAPEAVVLRFCNVSSDCPKKEECLSGVCGKKPKPPHHGDHGDDDDDGDCDD